MLKVGFGYGFSKKWCFVVNHLMAVNCSTRIKKMENHSSSAWFTFILLFFRICFFSIFFPIISSPVSCNVFFSVSLRAFFLGFHFVLWTWSSSPPWLLFFITSSYGSHPDYARLSEAASLLNWTTGSSSRTSETRSTACSWKWRSSPGSGEAGIWGWRGGHG